MTATHIFGVLFGLGAATCQSLSYLFSRQFTKRPTGDPFTLFVASHAIMGVIAVVLLGVLRPHGLPPPGTYLVPLVSASLFYLAAQMGLFHVLHHVESSRVSPLLGTKVVVLALLAVGLFGQRLALQQWAAVLVSAAAVWLLNEAGGRIPMRQAGVLALTIVGYCGSDLSIGVLVNRMSGVRPLGTLVSTCLAYVLCAALVLPVAFGPRFRSASLWRAAAPQAVAWFTAMCFLFACFALIGVVFGNIVQSSRGILSIAIGWGVARMGKSHLETHVTRAVFWRRLAGAVLMVAAVALYVTAP